MKPPPRARSKPQRMSDEVSSRPPPGKATPRWRVAEQKQLLAGLKSLNEATGGRGDLDCEYLQKHVQSRSVSEISSIVQLLKNQVFSVASTQLRKWSEEQRKSRRPIQDWTDLAADVTGPLEDTVSSAFCQMLIVSSTEPRTLRNSDPPLVFTPAPPKAPSRPTKPSPGASVPAPPPAAASGQPLVRRTLIRMRGPFRKQSTVCTLPNPPTAGTASPAATPQPVSSAVGQPSTSGAAPLPVNAPSTAASPGPASTSAAGPTRPGPPNKDPRADINTVSFEKIYCYLSGTVKPSEGHKLTPMESAIVLDLLMSLPEELPLLDCNKLQNHMIKVYECFSASADSKKAKQTFMDLKAGVSTQDPKKTSGNRPPQEAQSQSAAGDATASQSAAGEATGSQSAAGDAPASQSAAGNAPASQSAVGDAPASQSEEEDWMEVPPLNPFMVPLSLLQRKQEESL